MDLEVRQMVSIDVRFQCEYCGKFVVRAVCLTPEFRLGMDQVPDGWGVEIFEQRLRCFCPDHRMGPDFSRT